jgi:enamine deaminase RidA (YjgF/YER057c/UK114 family)
MGSPEARLAELGLTLPEAPKPVASYVPSVVTGRVVYVSGQVPSAGGALARTGLVGRDVSVEDAQSDARLCAFNALAVLREAAGGSLDAVARIVKLTVYVASSEGFHAQPLVANGASDLLVEVFGESGRHARAAVGVAALPLGATVEIDLVAELAG